MPREDFFLFIFSRLKCDNINAVLLATCTSSPLRAAHEKPRALTAGLLSCEELPLGMFIALTVPAEKFRCIILYGLQIFVLRVLDMVFGFLIPILRNRKSVNLNHCIPFRGRVSFPGRAKCNNFRVSVKVWVSGPRHPWEYR